MLNEIIWKLFLAFGMNFDTMIDTLVGVAVCGLYLGLICGVIHEERKHPGYLLKISQPALAILDHYLTAMQNWVEHFLMSFTPPEIWQSAPNMPSLGRIFLFLFFLPLSVNMVGIRWLLGWMGRRSHRG